MQPETLHLTSLHMDQTKSLTIKSNFKMQDVKRVLDLNCK